MAEPGTFERVLGEIGQALLPLQEAFSSPAAFAALAFDLGWRADDIPSPLRDLAAGADALYDELRKILGDGGVSVGGSVSLNGAAGSISINADDVNRVVHAVQQVVNGIQALISAPDSAIPAPLRADGFAEHFPKQLIDYLVVSYLRRRQPSLAFVLKALGVVKTTYTVAAGNRPPYMHLSLDFADLPNVLSDPGLVLRNAYGWGTADFDFATLAAQVDNLLHSLTVDTLIEPLELEASTAVQGPNVRSTRAIRGVFFERMIATGRMAAEVRLVELPADGGNLPGLALLPDFNGRLDFTFQLGPDIAVKIRTDLDLAGGVALQVRPGQSVQMLIGFGGTGGVTHANGSIEVTADRSATDGTPIIIFGAPNQTRLQFRKIGGAGGVRLRDSDIEVYGEFQLVGLEFVIQAEDGDGFISKILPSGGVGFGTDLTLGISSRDGFYFRGTSHLEIQVPAHVQLGPVEIQGLTIAANPSGGTLPINLGATFKAALGPLQASVENIGLRVTIAFPDSGGNAGPVDLQLGFKPPNGVGLAVNAGVVSGGGYLYIDTDRGEYSGALQLAFADMFTITAIGIITTKNPDGTPGFSLLILASVEFASGIQLGFGFTLLAVGGLLGLDRSANLQALADGVRSGSVTSVMFPHDVVANAPHIISDLRTFFPAHDGTFLIGPMAKAGWGTPTLVSLSLGVIIEIPGNIAILGVLKVALPAEDEALILIQVQFVGAIEFDKKRVWFFASLFDSRVVFIAIDGEMGLLVAWGDDANFVVSVGGFHPQFSPPPLPFPSPKRLELSLINTSVARISVQGYFAVTSNTAQFGARLEVFFGLDEINVQGHLSIDALFQFSPFHFIVEISASFSVNVFGAGLFSVGIDGELDGPSPWHVKGHGSISILFWDIGVDFETTWGDSSDTHLDPVAVVPILLAELDKVDNWRALPPGGRPTLVTLRPMIPDEAAMILHPMGVLRISQRAVPLDLHLDRVGNRAPSDVNRLTLSVASGGLTKTDDITEPFAPAQFINFSDADKLSQPAFEPEHSGLELSGIGQDLRTSHLVKRVLRYEEIIIDSNFRRLLNRFRLVLGALTHLFLTGNAAARSPLSAAVKAKLQPFDEKITVSTGSYSVAFQDTNREYGTATFSSAASANDFLASRLAEDPSLVDVLHVIPRHEVAA